VTGLWEIIALLIRKLNSNSVFRSIFTKSFRLIILTRSWESFLILCHLIRSLQITNGILNIGISIVFGIIPTTFRSIYLIFVKLSSNRSLRESPLWSVFMCQTILRIIIRGPRVIIWRSSLSLISHCVFGSLPKISRQVILAWSKVT
jgi:hypothetical protein